MTDLMDLRGLSCPQPVMRVRRALQESRNSEIKVLVDSPAARDNVERAARSMGWSVETSESDDGFILALEKT